VTENDLLETYKGSSVSLKQVTLDLSYKRGGKLIEVDKITVAPDGKRMATVTESKPRLGGWS